MSQQFTINTKISDVINDSAFSNFGRLIFPLNGYYRGNTLGTISLPWYSNIDPNKTVEIVNYMKSQVLSGKTIFYDIYSANEKSSDSSKNNTGFFFSSKEILVHDFQFVMQVVDFHALELSKKGYNAFALIY